MRYSAFIIDDEEMARSNLLDALSAHSKWSINGEFSSGIGLIEAVTQQQPDAVFLDIRMPGSSGLSLAKDLINLNNPPLVVFVTAYSDYAVRAFDLYAIDYLLKPFDDERLTRCVEKLENALANKMLYIEQLTSQQSWANSKPLENIIIKSSSNSRVIPIGNVLWMEANGNYIDIHHSEGKHLLRDTLKHLTSVLPQTEFIRVHRRFIVRRSLIRELITNEDGRYDIGLLNGQRIPVGKSYKKYLQENVFL